jgi:hypothetical protein
MSGDNYGALYAYDYSAGAIPLVLNEYGGNVGIGTTIPRALLDIAGSASLSANMYFNGASTAHTFNILDNGTLNFQRYPGGDAANNSSVLYLSNNGNVGIGTTAPASPLDIARSNLTTNVLPALTLKNLTAATVGVPQQYSPALYMYGSEWDGANPQEIREPIPLFRYRLKEQIAPIIIRYLQ